MNTCNQRKNDKYRFLSQYVQVEQLNQQGWARTYLVLCEDSSKAALIDPIWENLESDLSLLKSRGLVLKMVIGTHTHADHISAGWLLAERIGCEFIMLEGAATHGITQQVKDQEKLEMGSVSFTFHAAPGHTSDSMLVEVSGYIMTGDFLFNGDGGVGRDDLPGGDIDSHWNSLRVLDRFSGDVKVLSGHEPPDIEPRSLDWNRQNNPALLCSSVTEYEAWQKKEWQRLGAVRMLERSLPANLSGILPDQ